MSGVNTVKLGFIFRDKYKKNPSNLSKKEIDDMVFSKRKPNVISLINSIVSSRGNVIPISDYGDIETIFQHALKE